MESGHELELPQGQIRYRDSGAGRPLVFVHGLLVDGLLWRKVTPLLDGEFRCIAPDWPLGSHRVALAPSADRSPHGMARLIADFLEKLELEDVTLVANDTGGAIAQLLVTERPERIGRLVLTPCDCYENFFRRCQTATVARACPRRAGPRRATDAQRAGTPLAAWLRPADQASDPRRDHVGVGRAVADRSRRAK